MTRPELKIRNFIPTQALPGGRIRRCQIRVTNQKINHEKLEEAVEDQGDPSKHIVTLRLISP